MSHSIRNQSPAICSKDVSSLLHVSGTSESALRQPYEACFHWFTRLPVELRLTIWEQALPRPTIIPLTYCKAELPASSASYSILRANDLFPLLATCVESSKVANAFYHKHFGPPTTAKEVQANLSRDIIYLACSPLIRDEGMSTFLRSIPLSTRLAIRHLAVDERVYNPVIDDLPPFDLLPTLRHLNIVQHDDHCRRDWNDEKGRYLLKYNAYGSGTKLSFTHIAVPSVEEAMWNWVDSIDKDSRSWQFPKLRLVRLLVDGVRCCDAGKQDSLEEEVWDSDGSYEIVYDNEEEE